jgi:hypothetical protein
VESLENPENHTEMKSPSKLTAFEKCGLEATIGHYPDLVRIDRLTLVCFHGEL